MPPPPSTELASRTQLLRLVRQFGTQTTSSQILQPGYRYFWTEDRSACVAYVDTGGAWIGAGEPLCERARASEVAERFVSAARRAGRRAALFATETELDERHFHSLAIGRQPVLDPAQWSATLRNSRNLREQLRRARAKSVTVRAASEEELADASCSLRRQVATLLDRWRDTKPLPPMRFLVSLDPALSAERQRLWVAVRAGEIVGFARLLPIHARDGWFLEHLVRAPTAPNGTAELLVHTAIEHCHGEGSRYFTLGLAPLSDPVHPVLAWFRKRGRRLYDFEGLLRFKAKFRPQRWTPVYLAIARDQSAVRGVYESLRAFTGGHALSYALHALLRGPAVVLDALAVLLVPWILVLASSDAPWFFPVAWMRWFWVGFDLAVALGLWTLGRRFRPWLCRTLVAGIGFDAITTLSLVVAYEPPRSRDLADAILLALAATGPVLAFAVILGTWRRSRAFARRRPPRAEVGRKWPRRGPPDGSRRDSAA